MDWRVTVFFCFTGAALGAQPELRPPTPSVERGLNDSYVVFCTAGGNENVTWTKGSGHSINSGKGRVHVEHKGSFGLGLFFDRIEVSDKGQYTCTSASKEKTSFTLSVILTTKFVNTPTEHQVHEYRSTLIRCEVEGEPMPTVTWYRNGVSAINSVTEKNYKLEQKGLRIDNVTKTDAGVFTCRAVQFGREDSFISSVDITLKVLHKPEWKDPTGGPIISYGYLGGETNLSCEAVAQPEANYTWTRDGKPVKYFNLNASQIQEPEKSVLLILINNEAAYGKYKCEARNNLGSISRLFDLQKGVKPTPPKKLQLVTTEIHNATLEIDSDLPDLVGYRVQFVITFPGQSISWEHPHYQDLPKTNSKHYVVVDLLENTSYTARVAARSPAGLSDYAPDTVTLRTRKQGEISSAWKTVCHPLPAAIALLVFATVH